MESFLKADIFFGVTTISVVIITVLVVVIWWYLMKILKNFRNLSEKAEKEGTLIINDVDKLRKGLKRNSGKIKKAFGFKNKK